MLVRHYNSTTLIFDNMSGVTVVPLAGAPSQEDATIGAMQRAMNALDEAQDALGPLPNTDAASQVRFVEGVTRCTDPKTVKAVLGTFFKLANENNGHMWHFLTRSKYFKNVGTRDEPFFESVNPRGGTSGRGSFSFRIDQADVEGTKVYVINVVGWLDSTMIEAGKKYNLPRGFRVILYKNTDGSQVVRFAGFLPKFGNDTDRTTQVEPDANTDKMTFMLKMSGFLGMATALIINGKVFWLISSKNSCSNEFTEWAKDIFKDYLTRKLSQIAALEGWTLCGEMISKYDIKHGAIVKRNGFVLTYVSTDRVPKGKSFWNKFVEGVPFKETREIALEHGLPVTSMYVVKKKHLVEVLAAFHAVRDFMTLKEALAMFEENEHVEVMAGNVTHDELLGICLEGFVAHMHTADGKVKTVKIKFPFYIIRTMVIRQWLWQLEKTLDRALTAADTKDPNFLGDLLSLARDIVPRWCNKSSVNFWVSYVMRCGFMIQSILTENIPNRVPGKEMLVKQENGFEVGSWIVAAEATHKMLSRHGDLTAAAAAYEQNPDEVFGPELNKLVRCGVETPVFKTVAKISIEGDVVTAVVPPNAPMHEVFHTVNQLIASAGEGELKILRPGQHPIRAKMVSGSVEGWFGGTSEMVFTLPIGDAVKVFGHASLGLSEPCVLLLRGLPGVGKNTVAAAVEKKMPQGSNVLVVDLDSYRAKVRRNYKGKTPLHDNDERRKAWDSMLGDIERHDGFVIIAMTLMQPSWFAKFTKSRKVLADRKVIVINPGCTRTDIAMSIKRVMDRRNHPTLNGDNPNFECVIRENMAEMYRDFRAGNGITEVYPFAYFDEEGNAVPVEDNARYLSAIMQGKKTLVAPGVNAAAAAPAATAQVEVVLPDAKFVDHYNELVAEVTKRGEDLSKVMTPFEDLLAAANGDPIIEFTIQLRVNYTGSNVDGHPVSRHATLFFGKGNRDKVREFLLWMGKIVSTEFEDVKMCDIGEDHFLHTVRVRFVDLPAECPNMNGDLSHVTLQYNNPSDPRLPRKQRWREFVPKDSKALLEVEAAGSDRFPADKTTVMTYEEYGTRKGTSFVYLAGLGTIVMVIYPAKK